MQRLQVIIQTSYIKVITRARMAVWRTCPHLKHAHLSVSAQHTGSSLHHCLQVTNTGLAEFTPDHAPSVQLVATLLMTSPPRAPIGPETWHTCPIACRWSDVSRDRSRWFSVEWAWRRDHRRQSQRDSAPWLAVGGESERLLLREKGEGERFARGTDASAAPHTSWPSLKQTF